MTGLNTKVRTAKNWILSWKLRSEFIEKRLRNDLTMDSAGVREDIVGIYLKNRVLCFRDCCAPREISAICWGNALKC